MVRSDRKIIPIEIKRTRPSIKIRERWCESLIFLSSNDKEPALFSRAEENRPGPESSLASVDEEVDGVMLKSKDSCGFRDRERDGLEYRLTTEEWRLDFLEVGDLTIQGSARCESSCR